MNTRTILIIYYILVNLIGLGLMAFDKVRAMERKFRIPESVLLILPLIGSGAGSLLGMLLFHHKTRRPAFRIGVPLMLLAHILFWVLLIVTARSVVFH